MNKYIVINVFNCFTLFHFTLLFVSTTSRYHVIFELVPFSYGANFNDNVNSLTIHDN